MYINFKVKINHQQKKWMWVEINKRIELIWLFNKKMVKINSLCCMLILESNHWILVKCRVNLLKYTILYTVRVLGEIMMTISLQKQKSAKRGQRLIKLHRTNNINYLLYTMDRCQSIGMMMKTNQITNQIIKI